jgi:hypothetical protein
MTMITIGGDDVVVRPHEGTATDGDGFLADVKMEETADFFGLISAQTAFLETANADHLTIKLNALLGLEVGIDWSQMALFSAGGGRFGFFVGSGGGFCTHEKMVRRRGLFFPETLQNQDRALN